MVAVVEREKKHSSLFVQAERELVTLKSGTQRGGKKVNIRTPQSSIFSGV